ncbi:DegT/DnrJ/EryC1/StrS family aminotransferase [Candidatus Collierbacteria bacterium]|nr:DegT/DnrJ/EryC1/StrS family aminotransferase [Candidatus Collierbacteria bacterium]
MIPTLNPKELFSKYRPEIVEAIEKVIDSGVYLMGEELSGFEKEFADFLEIQNVVGVGSGTDALTLSLKAIGIRSDEDVIVPDNAYPTAFGVAGSGAHARFCDVEKDTLTISAKTIESVLTTKTKAIVVVHLYGMPVLMDEIINLARRLNIYVIEDCAQAVGAKIGNKYVGTFGDIGCFSFYPTKNLSTMGDGGAVVTNDTKIADRIRRLRMYGEDIRYHSLESSTHSRLEEIQAAILRVKLQYLRDEIKERQAMGLRYREALKQENLIPGLLTKGLTHGYHLFVVRSNNRDRLKEKLEAEGIMSLIHYPQPLHFQPAFQKIGHMTYSTRHFPVSENASKQILSLPFYPGLPVETQDKVLETVRLWI